MNTCVGHIIDSNEVGGLRAVRLPVTGNGVHRNLSRWELISVGSCWLIYTSSSNIASLMLTQLGYSHSLW